MSQNLHPGYPELIYVYNQRILMVTKIGSREQNKLQDTDHQRIVYL
jgi:hypothetical protein